MRKEKGIETSIKTLWNTSSERRIWGMTRKIGVSKELKRLVDFNRREKGRVKGSEIVVMSISIRGPRICNAKRSLNTGTFVSIRI